MRTTVTLATEDGPIPVNLVRPVTRKPAPAIILCVDAAGVRPSILNVAVRFAAAGYLVAVPDLFHRSGHPLEMLPPGAPRDGTSFFPRLADPAFLGEWFQRFGVPALKHEHLQRDIGAVLSYLHGPGGARPGPVSVVGYCMGGNAALRIAALFGEEISAAASIHGGFLATSAPDSPHLGAPSIKARVYVAAAVNDGSFPEEMKQTLAHALDSAGVVHLIETYDGCLHGFAIEDNPTYSPAAAARHDAALLSFL